MANFPHLISQHLYLAAEYCKKKSPNSADLCHQRFMIYSWLCPLYYNILQFYYIHLIINTSHFPQKLFEIYIFFKLSILPFCLLLSFWTNLLFFNNIIHGKTKTFFFTFSTSLSTIYSFLLYPYLPAIVSDEDVSHLFSQTNSVLGIFTTLCFENFVHYYSQVFLETSIYFHALTSSNHLDMYNDFSFYINL